MKSNDGTMYFRVIGEIGRFASTTLNMGVLCSDGSHWGEAMASIERHRAHQRQENPTQAIRDAQTGETLWEAA